MANRLCIVGVASSCLSLVLCIVGTAIPYWTYIHPTKSFASQFLGLWAQCSDVRGETVCLTYNALGFEVASWVKAVRAMEILGILLITAAAVCGALKLFAMRDRTLLLFVASGLSIAAGILMLIGIIIYAVENKDKFTIISREYSLHAGFALCVLSGLSGLSTGIVFFAAKIKN